MAGSIQGDINQALGTLGVLAQLSPELKEYAENKATSKKLDKQSKVADRAIQQTSKGIDIDNPMIADNDAYINALQNKEDITKKQFELNPTDKSYDKYSEAFTRNQLASIRLEYARTKWTNELSDLMKKQTQAMVDVISKMKAKNNQRRNFMNYISKMPMLGETVGSIDARHPGFAKKIASQYNKNDRERIMNQMDKEESNGKSN